MRIRSTLAAVALGIGALLVSAPLALADTQPPSSTAAPSPTVRPAPPRSPAEARQEATRAKPAERVPGQVVKPRGAAETGGGMDDESMPAGGLVLGGAGLLAVAGIGTVGYRRLRRQG